MSIRACNKKARNAVTASDSTGQKTASKEMVGRNLRRARELLFPTMAQCARAMEVEPGTWSLWELGKRYPDPMTMAKFCAVSGVSMDYLYRSDLRSVAHEFGLRLAAAYPELLKGLPTPQVRRLPR